MTGLVEMDLNSPEPDPASYGPWPVNRFVHGLDGNAALRKFLHPLPLTLSHLPLAFWSPRLEVFWW